MTRSLHILSGLATMVFAVAPALANSIYTNESTFQAAVQTPYYLEEFGSSWVGVPFSVSFSSGPYSYNVSATNGVLWDSPGIVQTNNSRNLIVITFTGASVTAFGGQFFQTQGGTDTGNVNISVTLADSSVVSASSVHGFWGITTSESISSVNVIAVDTQNSWTAIDHLYVGKVASAVPLPTSAGMGFSVLSALGVTLAVRIMLRKRSRIA